MKVIINTELCRGSGICQSVCPEVFELGKYGFAQLRKTEIPPQQKNLCYCAAKCCPVHAIDIAD